MRILLTNDDGYHAPGLVVLEKIAAQRTAEARGADRDRRSRCPWPPD